MNIYRPENILNELDNSIIKALKQEQSENDDGMDVCLCLLEPKISNQVKITFCGAKRPLIYYKNGDVLMTVMKGNHKPIGGKFYKRIQFTQKEILLNKDDAIYLTTDGLIDQNSPDRRKFGTPKLLTILTSNANLNMEEQKICLEKALDEHQDNESQRDDITIIGIRV
jgi:serine phosphatase RsbU (regulator of sigma subunit)